MNNNFIIENNILISYNGNETLIAVPDGVKIIGENVFKGMKNIVKVVLPESVTEIGENAFKGCKLMREINFPTGLTRIGSYAFHRCHALQEAILPDCVENLGTCAFLYCDEMKKVSIRGVKRLQRQTFANDTNLKEISFNKDVDTSNFGDDIFTGCVKINNITLSDGQVFKINNLIKALDEENPIVKAIAKSVYNSMKIENGKLYKFCVNLKAFELPEGIECIEKSCFYDKKGITSIIFPKSLKRIKSNAFGNCINLEEITFQNENTEIDDKAFKGCNNLKIVNYTDVRYNLEIYNKTFPVIIKKIREQLLSDFCISGKTLILYRGNEERVKIPEGVRIIGEGCFENNEKIGRIILPDSIEEIRERAFRNCVSMQTIELSPNLKIIERNAFENCRKLLKIRLPENTESIGESAFKRCINLNTCEINQKLKYIGDMAFYGCTQLKEIEIPIHTRLDGNLIFFNSSYREKRIKAYQFSGDDNITELEINEPYIIEKYAFSGCKNLKKVKINNPNCIIEEYAFEKCINLKELIIDSIGKIGKGTFSFCTLLEKVRINGTEKIEELAFFGCSNLKDFEISENVKSIGVRCFEECTSLKSFPFENVISIGERAFARCEGLEKISLSGVKIGYHAFEDCCNLKLIELNSGTYMKSGVFFSCSNIEEIILDNKSYRFDKYFQSLNNIYNEFPEKVQEIIGDIYSCFRVNEKYELLKYCGNSRIVKMPQDIVSIGDEAFRDCIRCEEIIIPETVEYIGKLAFNGTRWLEKMRKQNKITIINNLIIDASDCGEYAEIPENIKRICSWSFAGNCNLHEIKFLSDRIIIDEYAFRNCISLKKIITADGKIYTLDNINIRYNQKLPDFIRKIFTECINCFKTDETNNLIESTGNIKNLVFVDGIKSIGDGVYKDCNLLESITLSKDTEYIGKNAFENSKWLKKVSNAAGVREIGDFAFSGCQSLETIELSRKLESIGKRSFEHCCMLKEILIPESVTEIRERTFFRCKNLKRIILPSTLKIIKKEAFAFCENLEEVIIKGNTQIEKDAFSWCGNLKTESIKKCGTEN